MKKCGRNVSTFNKGTNIYLYGHMFPLEEEYRVEHFYNAEKSKLTLRLPLQYQARYFEIVGDF